MVINFKGINMRLIAPLIIALFGAGIGILICRLFVRSWLAYPLAAAIGAVSAFAGMILRDALDATLLTSNQFGDMLAAAMLSSLVVSIVANVVTSFISPRNKTDKD